ncbi:MAG: hypothetical protein EA398_05245 [Deltaproteobacteria bacterium]|nr:MAG: hypothetical protein EA398_05245 [Deltaproteobacteria bacterium]
MVLVDAASLVPTHHLRLGIDPGGSGVALADRAVRVGDLRALTLTEEESRDVGSTLAALRGLSADEVVLDLSGRPDGEMVSFLVSSDVPVLVAAAELHSLYATARWLQLATAHILRGVGVEVPGVLLHPSTLLDPGGVPGAAEGAGLGSRWAEAAHALSPWLVLNHTREAAERDLAPAIALSLSRMVGPWPRVLGAIDHDERRWFHMRQQQHGAPLSSDEGHGVQIRELAQRLGQLERLVTSQLRVSRPQQRQAHEVLGIPASAEPLEIRTMYRKLWEGLRRDSALTRGLLPPPVRDALLGELEQTNRRLQTWLAERPDPAVGETGMVPVVRPAGVDHPGARIREARSRRGMSRRELSLRTKIGLRVLDAIEALDVDSLPRAVYLRGYLREIARTLAMEEDALLHAYLDAVARARQTPASGSRRPGPDDHEETP